MLSYTADRERNFLLPSSFIAAKRTSIAQEKSRDPSSGLYVPNVQQCSLFCKICVSFFGYSSPNGGDK